MKPITVHVISDVVCPWCYIGKRQLEAALDRWSRDLGAPVEVSWHPFQLDPTIPAEGIPRDEYLQRKFGSTNTAQLYARLAGAAASVGLSMDFTSIVRQPNTLAAHALIAAMPAGAAQQAMVEALFRSYFIEAADLTARQTLIDIAERAGMSREDAAHAIDDRRTLDAVAEIDRELREQGVSGVPLFLVDRRFAVRGAQGADAIVSALEQAMRAREDTRPTDP